MHYIFGIFRPQRIKHACQNFRPHGTCSQSFGTSFWIWVCKARPGNPDLSLGSQAFFLLERKEKEAREGQDTQKFCLLSALLPDDERASKDAKGIVLSQEACLRLPSKRLVKAPFKKPFYKPSTFSIGGQNLFTNTARRGPPQTT